MSGPGPDHAAQPGSGPTRSRIHGPWPLGAALCALVLAWARPAGGGRADYVGPAVCGGCHQGAYAVWQQSAHARAGEIIGAAPNAGPSAGRSAGASAGGAAERRCLACHTTGEAPAGRPFFGGVTCEACHGPGAGYATDDIMRNPHLSRALGLRDLSTPEARAALCLGCHRAETRLRPFDPETAYRRIEHR